MRKATVHPRKDIKIEKDIPLSIEASSVEVRRRVELSWGSLFDRMSVGNSVLLDPEEIKPALDAVRRYQKKYGGYIFYRNYTIVDGKERLRLWKRLRNEEDNSTERPTDETKNETTIVKPKFGTVLSSEKRRGPKHIYPLPEMIIGDSRSIKVRDGESLEKIINRIRCAINREELKTGHSFKITKDWPYTVIVERVS